MQRQAHSTQSQILSTPAGELHGSVSKGRESEMRRPAFLVVRELLLEAVLGFYDSKRCEASRVALIGRGLNSWRRRMCAYVYEMLSEKSDGFGKPNLQYFFLGSTPLLSCLESWSIFPQARAFTASSSRECGSLAVYPTPHSPIVWLIPEEEEVNMSKTEPPVCAVGSKASCFRFSWQLSIEGAQVKYNPKGHSQGDATMLVQSKTISRSLHCRI